MLGTYDSANSSTIYLETKSGKLNRYLGQDSQGIEEAYSKPTKNGEAYCVDYKFAEGILVDIDISENRFNEEILVLTLESEGQKYIISTKTKNSKDYYNNMMMDFFRVMNDIDLSLPVRVSPWIQKVEGMENGRSRLFLEQVLTNGLSKKLEWTYAIEDIPPAVEKKKGKSITFNFDDRDNFVYEEIEKFKDKLKSHTNTTTEHTATDSVTVEVDSEVDDLPFD